ncbi:MAG: FGGY family carbohydrate kinase [Ferruginibacter sp.]
MLLLGIDVGTSSIKVAIVDADTQQCITTVQYPETETGITTLQHGWAEQSPEMWWQNVKQAILKAHATQSYDPSNIIAIGIAYQMHGLVCVDKEQNVLRDSIIWCDSRAVELGNKAFDVIGHAKSLQHLLNSPGNFTAAKLAWVKQNEPGLYEKIDKIMLPGDFIAMKLTGEITTSVSSLSEGIFWDFKEQELSKDVLNYFDFSTSLIPVIKDVFTTHGTVTAAIAKQLSLKEGIPVTYKAGDQPNNALSLNVLEPGEVAATAGTSGVIYGVSDELTFDPRSRINSFAHVNFAEQQKRIGVLLCINGTGILNRWIKEITGKQFSYPQMNEMAASVQAGSDGLLMLPFGNGAERMLDNRMVQGHVHNIDFNTHTHAHLFRAAQEGIAFAFRYGLDIMRENGMNPSVIRAGKANMFLSDVFTTSFVNATNVPVELHDCDGSVGAAKGAGIGAGYYASAKEAFTNAKPLALVEPKEKDLYESLYSRWKQCLEKQLA